MIPPEQRLIEDRALRNAARSVFDTNMAQVRADLAARGIAGRVADNVKKDTTDALVQGLAIASESKGIVAGVGMALLAWLCRKSLAARVQELFGEAGVADAQAGVQTSGDSRPKHN